MAGVDAGTLDREVTIQQLTHSRGSTGRPVETWATLDTEMMRKVDIRGSERFKAAQLSANYDTRWYMHYRAEMDPELVDVPKNRRLLYEGRAYEITAAIHVGRQEAVELYTIASSRT